jgi:hypothetical protein
VSDDPGSRRGLPRRPLRTTEITKVSRPENAARIADGAPDRLLTMRLAKHVMGWVASGDRYVTGNRSWLPGWRFRPAECIRDAFRLLEEARPNSCTMHLDETGSFCVRVQIGDALGQSRDRSKPRAITHAIARAVGLKAESSE